MQGSEIVCQTEYSRTLDRTEERKPKHGIDNGKGVEEKEESLAIEGTSKS